MHWSFNEQQIQLVHCPHTLTCQTMTSGRSRRSKLHRHASTGQQLRDANADPLTKPFNQRAYSSPGGENANFASISDKENDEPASPHSLFPTRPESGRRLTYASLPPTPITSSPPEPALLPDSPTLAKAPQIPDSYAAPFSLWDYLREELLATDFDSHQELKWERVSNFLSIPWAMEKVSRTPCAHPRVVPNIF